MNYLLISLLTGLSLSIWAQAPPQLDLIKEENILHFKLSNNDQAILSLPLDQAFLTVAQHETKTNYRYASYHFKEKTIKRCQKPVIEDIQQEAYQALVKGKFSDCPCTFELQLVYNYELDYTPFDLHITLSDNSYNRIFLKYQSHPEEHFYGFGQQYSNFDLKGKKPVLLAEESGIGRGDKPITGWAKLFGVAGNEYTTHFAVPFYINIQAKQTRYKALWLNTTALSKFDLTDPNWAIAELWDNHLNAKLWQMPEPMDLVRAYTSEIGRFPPLPDWG